MYEQEPHELLYWAYGWVGDVANAQKHILICLDYLRSHCLLKTLAFRLNTYYLYLS